MSNEVKANLLSPSHWLRILVMVFFAVVTWVLGIILTVLVVAQALFSLITGRDNPNLRQLGGSLSLYFYQVLRFLTYRSEFRPFPFAPFPIDDESEEDPAVHLHGQPHAPARQAPVARPDFASEHEPEPAAGAGMAQTAAATTAAAAAAQAAGTFPGAMAGVTAPASTAAAGEAGSSAPVFPEPLAEEDAESPPVLSTAADSRAAGAVEGEPAAAAEPAIVITESESPLEQDARTPGLHDGPAGDGNGTADQPPADDEHKHW